MKKMIMKLSPLLIILLFSCTCIMESSFASDKTMDANELLEMMPEDDEEIIEEYQHKYDPNYFDSNEDLKKIAYLDAKWTVFQFGPYLFTPTTKIYGF